MKCSSVFLLFLQPIRRLKSGNTDREKCPKDIKLPLFSFCPQMPLCSLSPVPRTLQSLCCLTDITDNLKRYIYIYDHYKIMFFVPYYARTCLQAICGSYWISYQTLTWVCSHSILKPKHLNILHINMYVCVKRKKPTYFMMAPFGSWFNFSCGKSHKNFLHSLAIRSL